MSDYIRKQEAIDRLSEVLSSEAEFEKAKQVIIEAPTLDETEIIRKAFERVVERLKQEGKSHARYSVNTEGIPSIPTYSAIKILKEECGINE